MPCLVSETLNGCYLDKMNVPVSLKEQGIKWLKKQRLTESLLSLHKERCFIRLGYNAGAVFDCIPFFKNTSSEMIQNNLVVQVCRLCLENEYIVAAFKAPSYFTYIVTIYCWNYVEKSYQNELWNILPVLHNDLVKGSMKPLNKYHVE